MGTCVGVVGANSINSTRPCVGAVRARRAFRVNSGNSGTTERYATSRQAGGLSCQNCVNWQRAANFRPATGPVSLAAGHRSRGERAGGGLDGSRGRGGARRGGRQRQSGPGPRPGAQMTHTPAPKLPFPVADPNVSYNQAISRRTTLRPPRLRSPRSRQLRAHMVQHELRDGELRVPKRMDAVALSLPNDRVTERRPERNEPIVVCPGVCQGAGGGVEAEGGRGGTCHASRASLKTRVDA